MQISLLQILSRTGAIAENCNAILEKARAFPASELCLCPANALFGFDLGCWSQFPSMEQGIVDALNVLAQQSPTPFLLPLLYPFKDGRAPAFYLLDHGQVQMLPLSPIEAQFRSPETPTLSFCELPWRGETIILLFAFCENPDARPLGVLQLLVDPASLCMLPKGSAVFVFTQLPWWHGLELVLEAEMSELACSLRTQALLVNPVGLEDGILYHGQSSCYDRLGALSMRLKAFSEDAGSLVLRKDAIANFSPDPDSQAMSLSLLFRALVFGTQEFVATSACTELFIGLSGGMDSALALVIACEAIGKEHVHAVFMPSPYTSAESVALVTEMVKRFGVPYHEIPIAHLMETYAAVLGDVFAHMPASPSDTTFENIQARIRGTLLCALANRANGLVVNTGNKSEAAMGYSTLYGDTIGAFSVLGDVEKTRVYDLAAWYNAHHSVQIPQEILTRPPSAELRPNQKDSDSLPPYEDLDPCIQSLLQGVLPTDCPGEVAERLFRTEFKRRQSPLAICVSQKTFGHTWRIPVTGHFSPK
ncbi:MAG: NAD(+) synthase [Desulfovibrio sp.]|nr:NAD(+) synthase [Desulfovibrio sp.]